MIDYNLVARVDALDKSEVISFPSTARARGDQNRINFAKALHALFFDKLVNPKGGNHERESFRDELKKITNKFGPLPSTEIQPTPSALQLGLDPTSFLAPFCSVLFIFREYILLKYLFSIFFDFFVFRGSIRLRIKLVFFRGLPFKTARKL